MKYNLPVKFIAILLTACTLVGIVACCVGIATLGQMNLYGSDLDAWLQRQYRDHTYSLAKNLGNRYANRTFSDAPETLLEEEYAYYGDNETFSNRYNLDPDSWYYTIKDKSGTQLESHWPQQTNDSFWEYSFQIPATYLLRVEDEKNYDIAYPMEDDPKQIVYLEFKNADTYTVTVYLSRNAFSSYNGIPLFHIDRLYQWRYGFIILLALSFFLFAAGLVFLCYISGKTSKNSPVAPGAFNRLPLDLYAVGTGVSCYLLVRLAVWVLSTFFYYDYAYDIGGVTLSCAVLLLAAMIAVGFFFAIAAQWKMEGGFWWRHTLVCRTSGHVRKGFGYILGFFRKLLDRLPLLWGWLLMAGILSLLLLAGALLAVYQKNYVLLAVAFVGGIAVILYEAYAYGSLLSGAKRMARGELHKKISTRFLMGSYSDLAQDLNTMADVVVRSAQKELRSERMKTELITNVSHDIKTPLTSIINYVDLLEKSQSDQERGEYLEVLGRQSQRLKKLIDDLMEMSKASSGNIPVELTRMDAAETINQALGEFSDKLAAAELTPVFTRPEVPVMLEADGRLTWRVLSNLLSNAVKYALPGTRLYIDLVRLEDCAMLSLKNISREALNVSAEELTERFVRGDTSRNTEGSGLGLNIAKTLMELQHGHLQVLVDGDLFKVTLVFPTC